MGLPPNHLDLDSGCQYHRLAMVYCDRILCETYFVYYRVIALISVNIVPSWDIEGRELASVRRYPYEGQYSPISRHSMTASFQAKTKASPNLS